MRSGIAFDEKLVSSGNLVRKSRIEMEVTESRVVDV